MFQTPWQIRRLARLPMSKSAITRSSSRVAQISTSNSSWHVLPRARRKHSTSIEFAAPKKIFSTSSSQPPPSDAEQSKEIVSRQQEFDKFYKGNPYPRWTTTQGGSKIVQDTIRTFRNSFEHSHDPSIPESTRERRKVTGRITSIRKSGSKLAFIDIFDNWSHRTLQVYLSHKSIEDASLDTVVFKNHVLVLRRGDLISVTGFAHKTQTGEFSIKATQLPELLAPCLQHFPTTYMPRQSSSEGAIVEKYVEMQTNYDAFRILDVRAAIVRTIRKYLEDMHFVEVETPILAASAGGATARPFQTSATEFSGRKLSLRVAPELWLKRLIIGGMQQIFEIGKCFRNEGLDKTHNPEFTTCEFYAQRWDISQLIAHTQHLLKAIFEPEKLLQYSRKPIKSSVSHYFMAPPYPQIDFIPALNEAMNIELPNLTAPNAQELLETIFIKRNLPTPEIITLPRLLDKLCSMYLEPQCAKPKWIINIPECLSPLAKSFIHPTAPNKQSVAARAELFVNGKELVNCYEEENSPFEQRRKFMDQQRFAGKDDPEAMVLDEDYLKALEWGLPPTGGWGMGIDRLVMLYTGRDKISDVLSFGNLRAVTRGAEKRNNSSE